MSGSIDMPYAELNEQRWHYRTWGERQSPALLLLHGFTGSHASWETLASRLQHHRFVIAPDLPGHGKTQTPNNPADLSLASTANRLALLFDHLSISKAAVLGYSMGGRLALHLALQNGSRVSRLALESASPGFTSAKKRRTRRAQDWALADSLEARGLAWFIPYWSNLPLFMSQSASLREAENRVRAAQSAHGLAQSLRGAGTGEQNSLWERLNRLSMPVLLVTGAMDAKFAAIAQDMAMAILDVVWVSVEEAGHTVHGEAPNRFYGIVSEFLGVQD